MTTLSLTCAVTCPGASSAAWTRALHAARTWSCTSDGCRRSAGSSPRRCRGGSRWRPGSTGPASSTRFSCVIDEVLEHSPAEHVRRPVVPAESPTLGFTHLQFEALLTAARESPDRCDFALVAMLGLLGLRIFEATGADIGDLGEEHGHRVLRVCGKGGKVVLVPLPPAVGHAIDRAIGNRVCVPILRNSRGARMDRHAATRRLRRLADTAGVPITRPHPHMLRHTFVICTGFSA